MSSLSFQQFSAEYFQIEKPQLLVLDHWQSTQLYTGPHLVPLSLLQMEREWNLLQFLITSASASCLSNSLSVLVRVSIAVKRHHGHGDSYKGKHLIEVAAYSF